MEINENVQKFLRDRTIRDVTSSSSQKALYREYCAYHLYVLDTYPMSLGAFRNYLKATGHPPVRAFAGRTYHRGIRLTEFYNPKDSYEKPVI
jgi:hypothetical protein